MFGLGPLELSLIALVLLLLFGSKRIPALIGAVGQGIRNFRTEIRSEKADRLPESVDDPRG